MNISSNSYINCNFSNVSFKSGLQRREGSLSNSDYEWRRRKTQLELKGSDALLVNATEMFRRDINWKKLGEVFKSKFSDAEKVNTYVYACSKGSEAYTLSMLLQSIFPSGASKFFPIQAKDIDSSIIENNKRVQKRGHIDFFSGAYVRAQEFLGFSKIHSFTKINEGANDKKILSDNVINPVEFSYANIIEDIDNIDSKAPSIIMCRNMWYYVNQNEFSNFADKLYEKLAPGSIVIIGEIDYVSRSADMKNFPSSLISSGFKPVDNGVSNRADKILAFEKI